jgi:hypothetical protein
VAVPVVPVAVDREAITQAVLMVLREPLTEVAVVAVEKTRVPVVQAVRVLSLSDMLTLHSRQRPLQVLRHTAFPEGTGYINGPAPVQLDGDTWRILHN